MSTPIISVNCTDLELRSAILEDIMSLGDGVRLHTGSLRAVNTSNCWNSRVSIESTEDESVVTD